MTERLWPCVGSKGKIEKDVADLESAHAGAWGWDATAKEEPAILRIQKKVRAEMRAERASKRKSTAKQSGPELRHAKRGF